METKGKTAENVQGTVEAKAKRKDSATFTLRAMGEGVKKLRGLELIDNEQEKQMIGIISAAVHKYVGG